MKPRLPTKAELQAKADYWQNRHIELGVRTDKQHAQMKDEIETVSQRAWRAEERLKEVRKTWNEWAFIEKEDDQGHAHVAFPKETLLKLLCLLRP